MTFASVMFLCFFLPCVLLGCFLFKTQYQNYWLLAVSLIFYAWGEPKFILVFIMSITMNYVYGLLLGKTKGRRVSKFVLTISILSNLGLLIYYKYLGLLIRTFGLEGVFPEQFSNIVLPIGISFYTFQAMSYLFDVYAEKAPVQKNFCKLALYISLFPQLIAGPIVRYTDVMTAIDNRSVDYTDLKTGIRRFSIGLAKKVLISNSVAIYADLVFGVPADRLSITAAWLGILCYTLQIYFDFSGYSDMAIGIGRMIGFTFPENFNRPYVSCSIQDFWRRWHISLSTWFKDYLYIPLGGKSQRLFQDNTQSADCVCFVWDLAWSRVDIFYLGPLPWIVPGD